MIIDEDVLITIFCLADDFCKHFEPQWQQILLPQKNRRADTRRKRSPALTTSEIMTIAILFHHAQFKHFKAYYTLYVRKTLKQYFPGVPSYNHFVHLMQRVIFPLCVFLHGLFGKTTGISFVDSTVLTVCSIRRVSSHKVFRGLAKKGKTSVGWFFGFKLHIIINHLGELLNFTLTAGNVDDRKPVVYLAKSLWGKLFGDRGYISNELFQSLWEQGIQLVTRLRKGMRNKLMLFSDMITLRKRGVVESTLNKLKNSCQIEHHRHRSPRNFLVNLFSGLAAYCLDPCKPTIRMGNPVLEMNTA